MSFTAGFPFAVSLKNGLRPADFLAASAPDTFSSHVTALAPTRYARHVGRVGALAVALGIGFAATTGQGAAVARADTETSSTGSETNAQSAPSDSGTETAQTAAADGNDTVGDAEVTEDTETADTDDPALDLDDAQPVEVDPADADPVETDPVEAAPVEAELPTSNESDASTGSEHDDATAPTSPSPTEPTDADTESEATADSPSVGSEEDSAPEEIPADIPSAGESPVPTPVVPAAAPRPAPLVKQPTTPAGLILGGSVQLLRIAAEAIDMLFTYQPSTPSDPPVLLAVMLFARREIERTFFNSRPDAVGDVAVTTEVAPVTVDVLANDIDRNLAAGDILTITSHTQTSNGMVVLNADGTFTYTPNAGFEGTDSFTYTISDEASAWHAYHLADLFKPAAGRTATVTLKVEAIDGTPTAEGDNATGFEDGAAVVGNVLGNDHDPRGGTLTVADAGIRTGAHGTLALDTDGSFVYTPAADEHGVDTFTYTVVTEHGETATGTLTVTVVAVNDAPIATGDAVATAEDTPVEGDVLSNDNDPDGDQLMVAIPSMIKGSGGTIHLYADGKFTYLPNPDVHGTDTFTYEITDGNGETTTATLTITVTAVNDVPVATGDAATTAEDTPVEGNVLTNDNDPDDEALILTSGGTFIGSLGTLQLQADGGYSYVPHSDAHGTDTFNYEITDGNGETTTATLTITVVAVNDAPVATGDEATTAEDTPVIGNVLSNDNDPDDDQPVVATPSTFIGSLGTLQLQADGGYSYAPNSDVFGIDTFNYEITDGNGETTTATLTITVTPVNDAPIATGDEATTAEDTPAEGNVLSNDTDPDDEALTLTSGGTFTGSYGTLQLQADGGYSYVPHSDANGTDTFTYEITDGNGETTTSTLTITVTPVDDTPTTVDDAVTTVEDTLVEGNVLSNDNDPDDDQLSVANSGTFTGSYGTIHLYADGKFTYLPNLDAHGTDIFEYVISDSNGETLTATLTITVTAANDTPIAVADEVTTAEDAPALGNVLSNDTDPDDDQLMVATPSTFIGSYGLLRLQADGAFVYIPHRYVYGTDTFEYEIADGNGGTATATLSITVTRVNHKPITTLDEVITDQDTSVLGNVLTNDRDPDGDPIWVTNAGTFIGSLGTLQLQADGAFTYMPDPDALGTDTFEYEISDGRGGIATSILTVTLLPVVTVPVDDGTITDGSGTVTVPVDDGTITDGSGTVTIPVDDGTITVDDGTITDGTVTIPWDDGTITDDTGTVTVPIDDDYTVVIVTPDDATDSTTVSDSVTVIDSGDTVAIPVDGIKDVIDDSVIIVVGAEIEAGTAQVAYAVSGDDTAQSGIA